MSHSCKTLATATSVWLLVSVVLCFPAAGREAKLTLHPQKAPTELGKFPLLPPESAMIDGDAVPLYEKAIQSLPDKASDEQIHKWLDMPIDQLPVGQVEQGLSKYMDSLKSVAKAVKCRQCEWPEWTPGMDVPNLEGYRRLAFVVRLWAKMEIANEGYEGAILALQTELGMSRQVGQAPTIIQVLVGTAIGGLGCRQIEEFVQGPGAPNLYLALASLPKPFVLMEKAIETEKKAAGSQVGAEGLLDPAHERCRVIVKRFETNLAALQCVEAIRSYAASHEGRLPQTLAEITEVSVPRDAMIGGPFRYTCTGSTAVLESSLPGGADEKDKIRYEISIRD
jgi:hypothetical protein